MEEEHEEDDWGDDFGTFEEAAEFAEAQPAGQAAEQAPAPPLPQEAPHAEAPEAAEAVGALGAPDLYSASPEELFDLVSPVHAYRTERALTLSHLEPCILSYLQLASLWLHGD